MTALGKPCKLFVMLCLAASPSLLFGQGTITSVTAASPHGPVTGITLNSPLPNGFTLTLNGTFNPSAVVAVHWQTSTGDTTFSSDGQLDLITPDQITLHHPALFVLRFLGFQPDRPDFRNRGILGDGRFQQGTLFDQSAPHRAQQQSPFRNGRRSLYLPRDRNRRHRPLHRFGHLRLGPPRNYAQ